MLFSATLGYRNVEANYYNLDWKQTGLRGTVGAWVNRSNLVHTVDAKVAKVADRGESRRYSTRPRGRGSLAGRSGRDAPAR